MRSRAGAVLPASADDALPRQAPDPTPDSPATPRRVTFANAGGVDRHRRALVLPPRRLRLLEKRAQPLLSFVARAPLGDPARRLRPLRTLAHEPLRPACRERARREQLADDPLDGVVDRGGHFADEADAQCRLRVEA